MKKQIIDFKVVENKRLHDNYSLLVMTPKEGKLPEILPGQFVQVQIQDSKNTFLRRPISVNFVEGDNLWLLVRNAGEGTLHLINSNVGDIINIVLPLGGTFTVPNTTAKVLLIGGGVGVAPLLFWGSKLKQLGIEPNFLIGARSGKDVLEYDDFAKLGNVFISTEDGTAGEKGLVTTNSVLNNKFDYIYCCGPQPMMKAVAAYAKKNNTECEVSLENKMACGIGACLCCVEETTYGNQCICTCGPIFNIKNLKWEI